MCVTARKSLEIRLGRIQNVRQRREIAFPQNIGKTLIHFTPYNFKAAFSDYNYSAKFSVHSVLNLDQCWSLLMWKTLLISVAR